MAVTQWYVKKRFAFLEKKYSICVFPQYQSHRGLLGKVATVWNVPFSSCFNRAVDQKPNKLDWFFGKVGWVGMPVSVFHLPAIAAGCLHHDHECGISNLRAQFPCGQHDLIKSLKDPQGSRIRFLHQVLQSPEAIF